MNNKTVTIGVESGLASARERFGQAMRGVPQSNRINFAQASDLTRMLTANRVQLLETMAGRDAMSVRAIADLVKRDVKAVHTDLSAMLGCGLLERTDEGLRFPFDRIHVDFYISSQEPAAA